MAFLNDFLSGFSQINPSNILKFAQSVPANYQKLTTPNTGLQTLYTGTTKVPTPTINVKTTASGGLPTSNTNTSSSIGGSSGGYSPLNANLLGTQNVFDPNSVDYNAIYAPALSALDQLGGAYQGGYDTALSGIDTSLAAALRTLGETETTQKDLIQNAKDTAYKQEEGTISDLTRAASELQQGNLARFGGGSSAGQASTEILGQGVLKGIGSARADTLSTLNQANQEAKQLETYVYNQKQSLNEQADQSKKEARSILDQQLAQIQTSKGQLESDKAIQRLNALKTYKDQLLSIDQYNNQLQGQVDQFNKQAQLQLQTATASSISNDDTMKNYLALLDRGFGAQAAADILGLDPSIIAKLPQTSIGAGFIKSGDSEGNEYQYNPLTKEVISGNTLGGVNQSAVPGYSGGLAGLFKNIFG